MSEPRVLWLSGFHPHPPDAGLTAYTAGLSEGLAAAGTPVRGLGLAGEHAPDGGTAATWTTVPGARRVGVQARAGLLAPLPNMAWTLALPAYRRAVAAELPRADVVVLDHLQTGFALPWIPSRADGGPLVVHLSHNDEATVRAEVARAQGGAMGAVLRLDAAKVAWLEDRVLARAGVLSTITATDAATMRARTRAEVVVIPPGWTGRPEPARADPGGVPRRVALLGNLHWSVKRANMEAFLLMADPLFAAAGADLAVIGPAPEGWLAELRPRLRATRFTGWVEDPAAELAQCRVGIVSEPAGGGFKMKSLDYVFRRLPMAVLAGSVAGLPLTAGTHYVERGDEAALAAAALELLDDVTLAGRMAQESFELCRPMLGWQTSGELLAAAIHRALEG